MPDIITLKALCEALKIDPREARERLRAAVSDAKAYPELATRELMVHSDRPRLLDAFNQLSKWP